jgi:hypothetical protein
MTHSPSPLGGPNRVGTSPDIKEVWDAISMKRLWDYLTRNASDATPYFDYEGTVRVLPGFTPIGVHAPLCSVGGRTHPRGSCRYQHLMSSHGECFLPQTRSIGPVGSASVKCMVSQSCTWDSVGTGVLAGIYRAVARLWMWAAERWSVPK